MQVDEYPAYLKKQSYEDLVSIGYSIDEKAQAKRYQMVLAEIAERDERGEGKGIKWHGYGTLLLGGFFILEFVVDLILSKAGWRPMVHLVLGLVCLFTAWVSRRKVKHEKPVA